MSAVIDLSSYPYVAPRRYWRKPLKSPYKTGDKNTEGIHPPVHAAQGDTTIMSKSTAVQSATEAVNQSGEIHVKEGTTPSDEGAEKIGINEAIQRLEQLMTTDPVKAKEAMKFLNRQLSEKHGVRGFARAHWGKMAIGAAVTIVVVAGVIYWVRSRSSAAADALQTALDIEASAAADAIMHETIARSIV